MRDNEWLYRGRLQRFVEELIAPNRYGETHPLHLERWLVPDEPVPFAEAVAQPYEPFTVGSRWGKGWSTMWLHVTGRLPDDWSGRDVEIVVDLGFRQEMEGGQAEALAYRSDGTIIKAIEPFNRYLPVEDAGAIDLYLECAANPEVAVGGSWQPTPFSSKATVPDEPLYVLRRLDAAVRNVEVWELAEDIEVLAGLVEELPRDLPRRAEIVVALNEAMDALDPYDVAGTASRARAVLARVLGRPAYASAHRVVATGHAHIDTVWLWPARETIRKCARTFANVLALLDEHPDLVFAASQAQQYAWIKRDYPELWGRIVEKVAEGRFVPAGGMWVECDTNVPGSEALARQFVLGKEFFLREFGVEPLDVWLPDTFGYSGNLPQIAKAAGSRWFLTQKMSWNETNTLPHHTFWWEGIDGTRIFTHLPPVDTYNSRLAPFELAKAERQYAEQGHGTVSLVPFGYGDGGGGPTREMVAKARRTADLEGSPTVSFGTPAAFFGQAEAELTSPHVWSGEMYLEVHRGTLTSQHHTKQANRRNEHLLRAAELWAATASVRAGLGYPAAELADCWQTVLWQQFHDLLPGCAIAWVYDEAEAEHARVGGVLNGIIDRSLAALTGAGERELVVNSSPVPLGGAPALGVRAASVGDAGARVGVRTDGSGHTLDNGVLRVVLDIRGVLTSVVDLAAGRELVAAGGAFGLLRLHNDRPSMYEAWDIDGHIDRVVDDVTSVEELTVEPDADGAVRVVVRRRFGASELTQTMTLAPGSRTLDFAFDVDWHEQRRLLRLVFETALFTERAASEIQFGHTYRPTTVNTSWDAARYETCAHRWVHVAEGGYGIAVANESTYGHSIGRDRHATTTPAGTTLRLSLLRGPKFPDPEADQGRHTLAVSLVCGVGLEGAIEAGQRLNQPVRVLRGDREVAPLVDCRVPGALVECIKLAQDGSGDVVVRLYEALGERTRGTVAPGFAAASVVQTDLLERDLAPTALRDATAGTATLTMRPFEIVTLRFRRTP